jgi:NADH-quinone oxidoreductase subunit N
MPITLGAMLGAAGLFNLLFFVYPGPLVEAATAAANSLF